MNIQEIDKKYNECHQIFIEYNHGARIESFECEVDWLIAKVEELERKSFGDTEKIKELSDKVDRRDKRIAELERERDSAIAHDRQPYPTADAYEKVCEANERRRGVIANYNDKCIIYEHRIAELEEWNKKWDKLNQKRMETIREQKNRIAELEEALRFYADRGNWWRGVLDEWSEGLVLEDRGEKARKALERE